MQDICATLLYPISRIHILTYLPHAKNELSLPKVSYWWNNCWKNICVMDFAFYRTLKSSNSIASIASVASTVCLTTAFFLSFSTSRNI